MIARSGVPVQVGYQRRFDAAFAAAKRAVDDGSLGPLHTVRSTTMDPAPPPMEYIAGSGGIFRDCAVHDFDVLRWVTGQPAVEVYATGSVQGDPRFTEFGDVDTAAVLVTFDRGTLGVVSAARYNGRGYDCRLEVHGFHDTVVAGWDQGAPMRNVDPDNEFPAEGPHHHFFMDRFTEAFRAELAAFVDVVNGAAAPACTVADAVEVAWLAEAATESLQPARAGPDRGGQVVSSAKIAGAPISWGVCEVPGWGYQLAPQRVLAEMRDAGLTATELGPEGFLPSDPCQLTALLGTVRAELRRHVRPRGAARRRPRPRARYGRAAGCARRDQCRNSGAGRGNWVRRIRFTADARRRTVGRCCWPTWTGSLPRPLSAVCWPSCTHMSAPWSRPAPTWTAC